VKKVYIVMCNNCIIWVFSSLKKAQDYCDNIEGFDIFVEEVL
jgi:hypothetical protein